MRAIIFINTMEDSYKIVDLANMSRHPVRIMKALRKNFYDKPHLVIEGRPTLLRSFIYEVERMGFRVELNKNNTGEERL